MRLQVFTATSMKIAVFWDVTTCSLVEIGGRFRGVCSLHNQGDQACPSIRTSNLKWILYGIAVIMYSIYFNILWLGIWPTSVSALVLTFLLFDLNLFFLFELKRNTERLGWLVSTPASYKIMGSSLGSKTGHPDWGFSCFFSVRSDKWYIVL
jgi:hypothetical protein